MTTLTAGNPSALIATMLSQDLGGGGFPLVGIGRSRARFDVRVRRPVSIVTHIALISRSLGHAEQSHCSGRLTQTARLLGYAREATWQVIGR